LSGLDIKETGIDREISIFKIWEIDLRFLEVTGSCLHIFIEPEEIDLQQARSVLSLLYG
jgi:hypothetical protein